MCFYFENIQHTVTLEGRLQVTGVIFLLGVIIKLPQLITHIKTIYMHIFALQVFRFILFLYVKIIQFKNGQICINIF